MPQLLELGDRFLARIRIMARVATAVVLREVPGLANAEVEQVIVALADHDDRRTRRELRARSLAQPLHKAAVCEVGGPTRAFAFVLGRTHLRLQVGDLQLDLTGAGQELAVLRPGRSGAWAAGWRGLLLTRILQVHAGGVNGQADRFLEKAENLSRARIEQSL